MMKEEKNYADDFIKPLLEALAHYAGEQFSYENREARLQSANCILKQKGIIKSSSEAYIADGFLSYAGHGLLLVEVCGPFPSRSRAKVQFDRHKGLYGALALLHSFADKYYYGSLATLATLEKLSISLFIQKVCYK